MTDNKLTVWFRIYDGSEPHITLETYESNRAGDGQFGPYVIEFDTPEAVVNALEQLKDEKRLKSKIKDVPVVKGRATVPND